MSKNERKAHLVGTQRAYILLILSGCACSNFAPDRLGKLDGERTNCGAATVHEEMLLWFKFRHMEESLVRCHSDERDSSGLDRCNIRRAVDQMRGRHASVFSEDAMSMFED